MLRLHFWSLKGCSTVRFVISAVSFIISAVLAHPRHFSFIATTRRCLDLRWTRIVRSWRISANCSCCHSCWEPFVQGCCRPLWSKTHYQSCLCCRISFHPTHCLWATLKDRRQSPKLQLLYIFSSKEKCELLPASQFFRPQNYYYSMELCLLVSNESQPFVSFHQICAL